MLDKFLQWLQVRDFKNLVNRIRCKINEKKDYHCQKWQKIYENDIIIPTVHNAI